MSTPGRSGGACRRPARRWIAALAVAWLLTGLAAAYQTFYVPPGKVSDEITWHQKLKSRGPALAAAGQDRPWRRLGIRLDQPDREQCALYVTRPLADAELAALQAQGIDVQPTYVATVPGLHPYGFYVATVPYRALPLLQADGRVMRLDSLEQAAHPQNDLAAVQTHVDAIHAGQGVGPFNGAGVKVAVADSGFDLTHPDIPTPVEAYDVTVGATINRWSTNVANTVTGHGTHVLGTLGGSGVLSGGKYEGVAPGASFYLYKVGDNIDASASDTDMIKAVNRAAAVGCRVYSMSLGGADTYMDGSGPLCQAIDAATAGGMLCFLSAGNEAGGGEFLSHGSATVGGPGSVSGIGFTIDNSASSHLDNFPELIYVIWRDNLVNDHNVTMSCTNLGGGESLQPQFTGISPRGTETVEYVLTPQLAGHSTKTYQFKLSNNASGGAAAVQMYRVSGIGTFDNSDDAQTITDPAEADGGVAIGCWTQRKSWTNYRGQTFSDPALVLNALAYFSSHGPRIDGRLKPDLVAPGAATISARDSVPGLASDPSSIIDNDGANLNGSGPANYYVMEGTSMATPHAAGIAALILQANPSLSAQHLRDILTQTATQAGSPNSSVGYGLVNALAAVQAAGALLSPVAALFRGTTTLASGGGPVSFGAVTQGAATPTVAFLLRNTGASNLTPINLTVPAGYTIIQPLPATIAAGSSATFTIGLATSVPGTFAGTVEFFTNDPTHNPYTFTVTGTVRRANAAGGGWAAYR